SLFHDREFWLKIGVDYDDVEEISSEDSTDKPERLLDHFLKRKRKVVESRFDSVQDFKNEVRTSDEPRNLLLSIYAESLWMQHWSDGVQFEYDGGTPNNVLEGLDADIDYEDVNNEFGIMWPSETRIRREKRDGEVVGTRPEETDPIVVKKSDPQLTIRAPSRVIDTATEPLRDEEDVKEVELESTSEQVTEDVQSLLTEEIEGFGVIGVKFNESELPERSRLRVKNERSIEDDLSTLSDRHIISTEGISAVQKIYLRDLRQGGKYRINVIHGAEGFRFELEAPEKLEEERERFKHRFTRETGIDFDIIYEYGSQDQRHLFNRVLSGDGDAYDRYYDDLEEELQSLVDEFADMRRRHLKLCRNPHCGHANPQDVERCQECDAGEFSDPFEDVDVSLNESRITAHIQKELETISPDPERFDISGWQISSVEMNEQPVVQTDFQATEFVASGNATVTQRQVFFVPQGGNRRPQQIDNYLLDCVYVTFGDSSVDSYDGYGRISLYDLLTTDRPEKVIGKGLQDAISGTRARVFRSAQEAYDDATEYLDILDRENALSQYTDELEDIYAPSYPDYFEKHVFYLLKGLFAQTERWGRTTEKEADGLLVIPTPGERDDYAAKMDMKISHSNSGYSLGTEGEDQAARYMSNSAEEQALRAKTGRTYPSAHILISQNFDQSNFSRRADGTQSNLSELAEDERPDLVFMEFAALVELYELEQEHYEELDNPDIKRRFREIVIKELTDYTTEEGVRFVHFDRDSTHRIKDALLSVIDQYDHEPVKPYSN
ncbi:MAG: hypothetical protein ABEI86_13055, partial [Halobacteriaceae archaeon]